MPLLQEIRLIILTQIFPSIKNLTQLGNKAKIHFRARAIKELKNYSSIMKSYQFEQKFAMGDSLKHCYSCLKEILELFMEKREFVLATKIYKMLAEVALLARDYRRAIKYFAQIV